MLMIESDMPAVAGRSLPFELMPLPRLQACPIDHEHGGSRPIEAELVHVVDGADREPVQELQRDWRKPRGGDPATASPALSSVGKKASIVARGAALVGRRTVASVMIPSVPWLPTIRCVSE